ncbi:hypothetical protein F4819DRAFT_485638 [Hypoxylon fuscum]|nr:hypothetical protein F4819DRAFT_485638 [Hypoxylon fuscum]
MSNQDASTSKTQGSNGEADVSSVVATQTELAQAFKDIARGEQQAAALEANLTSLESKLDALLASIEGGSTSLNVGQGNKTDPKSKDSEANE